MLQALLQTRGKWGSKAGPTDKTTGNSSAALVSGQLLWDFPSVRSATTQRLRTIFLHHFVPVGQRLRFLRAGKPLLAGHLKG